MRVPALLLAAALWLHPSMSSAGGVTRATLPNGLAVAAATTEGEQVSGCLTLTAGSGHEQPGEEGAALLLARVLAPEDYELTVDSTRWCASAERAAFSALLARLAAPFAAMLPSSLAPDTPDADVAAREKLRGLAYQGAWALDHDARGSSVEPSVLQQFRRRTYTSRGARLV